MGAATAQQARVDALAAVDPTRPGAQQAAWVATDTAVGLVSGAQGPVSDALERAARADQHAAAAIEALTGQLDTMDAAGGTAHAPGHHSSHQHAHHGGFYDAVGGFGDGAWKIELGMVGDVVGLIPTHATHAVRDWLASGHDDLQDWYGADTDSAAYRDTSSGTQVAGFFIPGEGWVKGAQAATEAGDAARVLDGAVTHSGEIEHAAGDLTGASEAGAPR